MKKSELVKEKIIAVTIDLIQDGSGDIDKITTRNIAILAGVGTGLINYHFQSKDRLIEICVQRIISSVIENFKPDIGSGTNPVKNLKKAAKLVVDFLIENPSVSRISILGDMNNPGIIDNTMKAVMGFLGSINNFNISNKENRLLAFSLTTILQGFFIRKAITRECFEFDFNKKKERDVVIDYIIDKLFEGSKANENINY